MATKVPLMLLRSTGGVHCSHTLWVWDRSLVGPNMRIDFHAGMVYRTDHPEVMCVHTCASTISFFPSPHLSIAEETGGAYS